MINCSSLPDQDPRVFINRDGFIYASNGRWNSWLVIGKTIEWNSKFFIVEQDDGTQLKIDRISRHCVDVKKPKEPKVTNPNQRLRNVAEVRRS